MKYGKLKEILFSLGCRRLKKFMYTLKVIEISLDRSTNDSKDELGLPLAKKNMIQPITRRDHKPMLRL